MKVVNVVNEVAYNNSLFEFWEALTSSEEVAIPYDDSWICDQALVLKIEENEVTRKFINKRIIEIITLSDDVTDVEIVHVEGNRFINYVLDGKIYTQFGTHVGVMTNDAEGGETNT